MQQRQTTRCNTCCSSLLQAKEEGVVLARKLMMLGKNLQ
jgi:hypothetical protein